MLTLATASSVSMSLKPIVSRCPSITAAACARLARGTVKVRSLIGWPAVAAWTIMSTEIPASLSGCMIAATVPGRSAIPVSVIRPSLRSDAMPAMALRSILSPSSATISVPGTSSNALNTRNGIFSRIASPTLRT